MIPLLPLFDIVLFPGQLGLRLKSNYVVKICAFEDTLIIKCAANVCCVQRAANVFAEGGTQRTQRFYQVMDIQPPPIN
jgi:hypothetical protein